MGETIQDVAKQGVKDIADINTQISKLKQNLADITTKGQSDLANRGLDIAKQIDETTKKINDLKTGTRRK